MKPCIYNVFTAPTFENLVKLSISSYLNVKGCTISEGLVPDDDSVEDQRFFNISDTFAFSTHSTTWDASSVSLNTQEMIFLEYRSITLV